MQLVHLAALARARGVEVVAVADADPERREAARRRVPGAAALADYAELVASPGVDAVVIALPSHLHAEAALAALAARKHVYVEKPLATTVADGASVVDAWREAGMVGMVGFNYRFNAHVIAARRQLEAGSLGPLVGARSTFTTTARDLPEWKRQRETGGGVLLDLASHHFDLARFLLGREIEEVYARLASRRTEHDTASLELRLQGDVPVQSFLSLAAPDVDTFEVVGEQGRLLVDRMRATHVLDRLLARGRERSFELALAHFAAAAQAGTQTTPDLADGLRSLAAVAAAEESAASGRAVAVPRTP